MHIDIAPTFITVAQKDIEVSFKSNEEKILYFNIDFDINNIEQNNPQLFRSNQPLARCLNLIPKHIKMNILEVVHLPNKRELVSLFRNLSKSKLIKLNFHDCNENSLPNGRYETLAHLLKTRAPHSHVKNLVIETYNLPAKQIKDLSSTFRNLHSLTLLDSRLGNEAEITLEFSKRLRYLKKLNNFCFISFSANEDLINFTLKSLKYAPLKKLYLGGYAIKDERIYRLIETGILTQLEELVLPSNQISDNGLNELAKHAKNIKRLYSSSNNRDINLESLFTEKSLEAFFCTLANTNIEELHLARYHKNITTQGLNLLADHLASKLTLLNLWRSGTFANLSYLLEQLSIYKKIESLYIGDKNLSKTDFNLIISIINNQKLRYLDISYSNEVDDANNHNNIILSDKAESNKNRKKLHETLLKSIVESEKHHPDLKVYAGGGAFLFPLPKKTETPTGFYDHSKKKVLNTFGFFNPQKELSCIEPKEIASHPRIPNRLHYSNRFI